MMQDEHSIRKNIIKFLQLLTDYVLFEQYFSRSIRPSALKSRIDRLAIRCIPQCQEELVI